MRTPSSIILYYDVRIIISGYTCILVIQSVICRLKRFYVIPMHGMQTHEHQLYTYIADIIIVRILTERGWLDVITRESIIIAHKAIDYNLRIPVIFFMSIVKTVIILRMNFKHVDYRIIIEEKYIDIAKFKFWVALIDRQYYRYRQFMKAEGLCSIIHVLHSFKMFEETVH